jgi:hypothetical protein
MSGLQDKIRFMQAIARSSETISFLDDILAELDRLEKIPPAAYVAHTDYGDIYCNSEEECEAKVQDQCYGRTHKEFTIHPLYLDPRGPVNKPEKSETKKRYSAIIASWEGLDEGVDFICSSSGVKGKVGPSDKWHIGESSGYRYIQNDDGRHLLFKGKWAAVVPKNQKTMNELEVEKRKQNAFLRGIVEGAHFTCPLTNDRGKVSSVDKWSFEYDTEGVASITNEDGLLLLHKGKWASLVNPPPLRVVACRCSPSMQDAIRALAIDKGFSFDDIIPSELYQGIGVRDPNKKIIGKAVFSEGHGWEIIPVSDFIRMLEDVPFEAPQGDNAELRDLLRECKAAMSDTFGNVPANARELFRTCLSKMSRHGV